MLFYIAGKGLEILYQNSVVGAAHDAEQRFPPPNCYPGTRTETLEILRNWVNDSTKTASIYWLYGAAGVGKSAIAQTVSEEFANSHLAASFFFSRADPTRNNLQHFFTTVSLQMATSHVLGPILSEYVDLTVRRERNIVHAKLERQFQELVAKPCHRLTAEQWNNLPQLIVIDGLDECIDIASQERLLSIIREAKSGSMVPFKFLICSRPEPRIRNAFNHQVFVPWWLAVTWAKHLNLGMTLPGTSARNSIEFDKSMAIIWCMYLKIGLAKELYNYLYRGHAASLFMQLLS
ncbi:hypothetical protein GYMLUDRAFT_165577 [Collybiopsis luxurians FD-317 M1]|uniref:Nephrocystin 3-like N-terminal domain-containing protein n=1 Tax=Collybiopsis luxurians FD-317 M1 TaxID=944289 RepID=A0A0D0CZE2_9AGAR|nr:hypothetical protein GYMLUDRAFT_165577 [Collybiopsis luxurians FD-317 M1]